MANVTIPNLTSATTIAPSTDLMVLEQTEGTRKATLSQIFTSSATSGSGLGITSGGVYAIKSGLDSDISDINTLLGNTSIASIGDGTVTGAVSQINSDLTWKPLPVTNWGCTIPATAKEVAVAVWDSVNKIEMSKIFVYDTLDFTAQEGVITILDGWYFSPSNCGVSTIKTYTNNYLSLHSANINGSDVKNSAQMVVYYR